MPESSFSQRPQRKKKLNNTPTNFSWKTKGRFFTHEERLPRFHTWSARLPRNT